MRIRTFSIAGLGAAALVLAALSSGAANASGSHWGIVSVRDSATGSSLTGGPTASKASAGVVPFACGTSFGSPVMPLNAIISSNDTSGTGIDTAGAADVFCATPKLIHRVKAWGFGGTTPTDTFNVTFYANDPAGSSSEPNDNIAAICSYTNLVGAAGGAYPSPVKTVLTLSPKCQLPAGAAWVSIQNNDATSVWYWQTQSTVSGAYAPDWVDRNDVFMTGCTAFDNNLYLLNCLGYPDPDFMLRITI